MEPHRISSCDKLNIEILAVPAMSGKRTGRQHNPQPILAVVATAKIEVFFFIVVLLL